MLPPIILYRALSVVVLTLTTEQITPKNAAQRNVTSRKIKLLFVGASPHLAGFADWIGSILCVVRSANNADCAASKEGKMFIVSLCP